MAPSLDPNMDSPNASPIALEVLPYLKQHKDGTIQRLVGTQTVPPNLLPTSSGVTSKDVLLSNKTGVYARIYRPYSAQNSKLPLLVYFHGGAFLISSPADPAYHNSLTALSAEGNFIIFSVAYRKSPEHPFPSAYDDAEAAVRWVFEHSDTEEWLAAVDLDRVFLGGDSAGANIAHHVAMCRAKGLDIAGLVLIHPYFWGESRIGSEADDPRSEAVDAWWRFVCVSGLGCDDPLINPFVEGSPDMSGLKCGRVLVCVAGEDVLRERGRLYYRRLVGSAWDGKAEIMETSGEDHVFHIFQPEAHVSGLFFKRVACFVNHKCYV